MASVTQVTRISLDIAIATAKVKELKQRRQSMVSEVLKDARIRSGFSLADVGKHVGRTRQNIWDIEKGARNMTDQDLIRAVAYCTEKKH